jgi:16S rRNA (guanine(966)-N(2))-methyltransferase RsmD
MRIIAGSLKGHSIRFPANQPLRPTSDYCKEALFNIIDNHFYFDRLTVLDLFTGTGSVSLEFASRGCPNVTSVDINFKYLELLKAEVRNTHLEGIRVIREDAVRFLQRTTTAFDIIFADPPYDYDAYDQLIAAAMKTGKLKDKGWFILEHSSSVSFQDNPLAPEHRSYGQTSFSIFKQTQ